MRRFLIQGHFVMLGFLVTGCVAAWFILQPIARGHEYMYIDPGHYRYIRLSMLVSVMLGIISGYWFALVTPRRALMHALLFSAFAVLTGLAVDVITSKFFSSWIDNDTFRDQTRDWPTLTNMLFNIGYWIEEGLSGWLIPQLMAQFAVISALQFTRVRNLIYRKQKTLT